MSWIVQEVSCIVVCGEVRCKRLGSVCIGGCAVLAVKEIVKLKRILGLRSENEMLPYLRSSRCSDSAGSILTVDVCLDAGNRV